MFDLCERALGTASRHGADYADVRRVETETETVATRNGEPDAIAEEHSVGLGVRVLVDGAWGFASSAMPTAEEADRIAAEAVRIARASARVPGPPVSLGPTEANVGTYRTPVAIDAFGVPLEEKLDLLLAADRLARAVHGVAVVRGSLVAIRETRAFGSSEGARIEQTILETGGGLEVTAVGSGDMQKRSYPNSFGRHQATAGWELVVEMDLPGNARRIALEAAALLDAEPCPAGVATVILDGTQVALQVHESCGHPIELDRVFGTEAAYAGTSFLTPEKLGAFRYGSPRVNLTADATIPGGLGTFGYDDEGVPAQRVELVSRGLFTGYLSSRETAARIGLPASGGAMRAESWDVPPLIRMTNVNLEPGTASLDELLAGVKHGYLLSTNKSWSIDDRRLNFQFTTELGWEITDGKLGRLVSRPLYTGITPEFWGRCTGVGRREDWQLWGIPNCAKGEPMQLMHVGHGAPYARFDGVFVGPAT